MKKFKLLVVSAIAMLFVTGCGMKMNLNVTIDKDKNLDFSVIMAMDNELIDSMLSMSDDSNANPTDTQRWAYVEEAFKESLSNDDSKVKSEKYEEGEFKGYKITSPAGKIDLFTKETASERVNVADMMNDASSLDNAPALFVKDGNKYVSNITFDAKDNESLSQMNQYSSSMDLFEMNFIITLPVKPSSNNADKVSKDGKTLTWDLTKAKDIKFEFDFDAKEEKDNNLLYIIGGCVAGVAVVAIAAVVIMNNKKKKTVAE